MIERLPEGRKVGVLSFEDFSSRLGLVLVTLPTRYRTKIPNSLSQLKPNVKEQMYVNTIDYIELSKIGNSSNYGGTWTTPTLE